MSDLAEKACLQLKTQGLRLTGTRKKLVKAILDLEGHWTIQEKAPFLQKKVSGVGIATIYRTVLLLAKGKFLSETSIGRSASRYEVTSRDHHDHLSCVKCGHIFEFENPKIEKLQSEVARQLGFDLVDHRMELYGSCRRSACPYSK